MPISYFIINHNDRTLRKISGVLKEFAAFSCLGTADSYEEGMTAILKTIPDVVFINIDDCPPEEYKDVFAYCSEINNYIPVPKYVALSEDGSKAYRALKNEFFDYLLKPGKELDIQKTALRLLKKQQYLLEDTLCLKSYKDYTLLRFDDILFLKADNNATDFVLLSGETISAFKTLKSFENVLPDGFIRIHHSYIINKNKISRINFGRSKCYLNHNKISLPFSKTYRHNLDYLEGLLEERAISFNQ